MIDSKIPDNKYIKVANENYDTRVLAFAQEKGGSGKTTIAAHMAVVLANRGYKIAIIDITPHKNIEKWYNLRETKLSNLAVSSTNIWNLHSEIEKFKVENFDIILIDTAPYNPMDSQMAFKFADLAIIPVQPSPLDIWTTNETIHFLDQERIPYRILWNRVLGDYSVFLHYSKFNANALNTHVPNHIDISLSMSRGLTIIEQDPNNFVTNTFYTLSEEILNLIVPNSEDVKNELHAAV